MVLLTFKVNRNYYIVNAIIHLYLPCDKYKEFIFKCSSSITIQDQDFKSLQYLTKLEIIFKLSPDLSKVFKIYFFNSQFGVEIKITITFYVI